MDSSDEEIFISNNIELRICIASITGHSWTQSINNFETVATLKQKIWNKSGVPPHHQGLIFAGKCLSNKGNHELLRDLGVRENSLIRLLVITRSGPLSIATPHSVGPSAASYSNRSKFLKVDQHSFFDVCHIEGDIKRNSSFTECTVMLDMSNRTHPAIHGQSAISAPEDTSAKESSAGDTEHDEDKNCLLFSSLNEPFTKYCEHQATSKTLHKRIRRNSVRDESMMMRNKGNSARDQLLLLMNARTLSPPTDLNTLSEDGSELSSGVVICNLTNDFRKLRVRKKHGVNSSIGMVQKGRTKSRSRIPTIGVQKQESDITSSDEERPYLKRSDFTFGCTSSRRTSGINRSQRNTSAHQQYRCHACSAKLNTHFGSFQCRCGKTLCVRHRPAEMHMCARTRKLQDVSD